MKKDSLEQSSKIQEMGQRKKLPLLAPLLPSVTSQSQVSLAGKWNVQLGSFSSASNARGLQRKLRGKGFDAFIVSSPDQKLHRVLVGPYSDRNRADAAIPKLRKLTGLDGVTRRVQR